MPSSDANLEPAPITEWVNSLRNQDSSAARALWDSFRNKLESLAKRELAKLPFARTFDEEDIALSAFHTFCQQVQAGKFSELANRDELWWLLIVITRRKAGDRIKHEQADKRVNSGGVALTEATLNRLESNAPSPVDLTSMREQCEKLLDALQDDELRYIAIWKLEGHTNDEIASRLMRTRQTVQRKLNLVRGIWSTKLYDGEGPPPVEPKVY